MVLAFFDQVVYASIVPASFIVINYMSLKRNKKGAVIRTRTQKNK